MLNYHCSAMDMASGFALFEDHFSVRYDADRQIDCHGIESDGIAFFQVLLHFQKYEEKEEIIVITGISSGKRKHTMRDNLIRSINSKCNGLRAKKLPNEGAIVVERQENSKEI